MRRYNRGERVSFEGMGFDVPFTRVPVRVIDDSPDLTMLWLADGTTFEHRVLANGDLPPRVLTVDQFRALETVLVPNSVPNQGILFVSRPADAASIRMSWEIPDWRFRGWYVNLETPIERTSLGFRTIDLFLDIVVSPDRSWVWEDEEELGEAVAIGRLTHAEADVVRAEGERLIADIEARRFPFDDSLLDWRPDPEWTAPEFSEKWKELDSP